MLLHGMLTFHIFFSKTKRTSFVRWWRAPEVYIYPREYDEKLDLWSVGCIMAELILLRPVFAGDDVVDQLNKIFNVIGTPDLATLNDICKPGVYNKTRI